MPPLRLDTKIAYGIGQLGEGFKNSSFETFLFFSSNRVLGLAGTLAGLATELRDALASPTFRSVFLGILVVFGRRGAHLLRVEAAHHRPSFQTKRLNLRRATLRLHRSALLFAHSVLQQNG